MLSQNFLRGALNQRQQDFNIFQRHGWVQQRQLQAGDAVVLGHTNVRTAGFQQRITNFLVQQGDARVIHLNLSAEAEQNACQLWLHN